MTWQELKTEICRRLNIDYEEIRAGTNDLFKWDDLESWGNTAIHRAWDYHDWPFAEKTYTTTTTATATDKREYYDYPQDFISNSIKLLAVKDENSDFKVYEPINYEDFAKVLMEDDENNELLWTSHGRYYLINQNAYDGATGRTIELVGKMRCDNLTSSTALLPFSEDTDNEESGGNEAIVKLAYSIALSSEKLKMKARGQVEEQEALKILEDISGKDKKLKAGYQHKGRPQFNVPRLF